MKIESGSQKVELSCGTTQCQLQELSITDPNRKRCALHLFQDVGYPNNSVNEKPSSPWTPAFLQQTFSQNTPPPTSYFFSIKQHSSPLFVGLAYGFWVSLCGCVLSHSVISARLLCPWDSFSCLILQFLCYSWTDPLLLVKQHFKVNLFIPVSHNPHSFTMLPGVTSQGNHPLAPNPCLRLCC